MPIAGFSNIHSSFYSDYCKKIGLKFYKANPNVDNLYGNLKFKSAENNSALKFDKSAKNEFISLLSKSYISDIVDFGKSKRHIENELIQPKLDRHACGLLSVYRGENDPVNPMNLLPIMCIKSMLDNQPDIGLSKCNELVLDLSNSILKNMTAGQQIVPLFIENEEQSIKIHNELENRADEFINNPHELQQFLDENIGIDDAQIRQYSFVKPNRLFIRNQGHGSSIARNQPKFLAVTAPWTNHFKCPKAEYPLFFVSIGSGVAPAISMVLERIEDAKNRNVKIAKTVIMVGYEDKNSAYALNYLEYLVKVSKIFENLVKKTCGLKKAFTSSDNYLLNKKLDEIKDMVEKFNSLAKEGEGFLVEKSEQLIDLEEQIQQFKLMSKEILIFIQNIKNGDISENIEIFIEHTERLAKRFDYNLQILVAYKDNKDMPYTLPKLDAKTKKIENHKCILDEKQNLITINRLLNMKNVHVRLSGYLDLQEQLKQTSARKVKNVSGLLSGLASYFVNHRLKSLDKQGRIEAEGVSNQKRIQINTQAE